MLTLPPIRIYEHETIPSTSDAWVWRTFSLEPTEFCVRYFLQLDSMPTYTAIEINGHIIVPADTTQSLTLDVTDFVALDENRLGFKLAQPSSKPGQIRLLPIACDEL